MVKVGLSILSCDLEKLLGRLDEIERSGVNMLHIDVMDGNFVPNLTFGPEVVRLIKGRTKLFLDLHLMVNFPAYFVKDFAEAGADLIVVHAESQGTRAALQEVKNRNKQVGLALKPQTSLLEVEPYIEILDLLLVMTVEPGFGSQPFLPQSKARIKRAKEMIQQSGQNVILQVDGGINAETGRIAVASGADLLVSGSWLFSGDMKEKVATLKLT